MKRLGDDYPLCEYTVLKIRWVIHMHLVDCVTPLEWEAAKAQFSGDENLVKWSRKKSGHGHSFIKINGNIYIMARNYLGQGSFSQTKIIQNEKGENYKLNISDLYGSTAYENNILMRLGEFYGEVNIGKRDLQVSFMDMKNWTGISRKTYRQMKLHEGDTLAQYLRKELSVLEKITLAIDLVSQLDRLHTRCIIHGDIKPENIIVDKEGKVHYIDFNASIDCLYGEIDALHRLSNGTLGYIAPEIREKTHCHYSMALDVFALGCLFLKDLKLPRAYCQSMLVDNPNERIGLNALFDFLVKIKKSLIEKIAEENCTWNQYMPIFSTHFSDPLQEDKQKRMFFIAVSNHSALSLSEQKGVCETKRELHAWRPK